jgi:hypothetical protein
MHKMQSVKPEKPWRRGGFPPAAFAAAFQPPPTDTSTPSHSLFNPAPPEAGLIPNSQTDSNR